MPGRARLVFGFPDLHWFNRDERAVAIATRAHALLKPETTVLGGDLWDATPFSRFGRKALEEMRHYLTFAKDEMLPSSRWLSRIERHTDKIVWLEGNHDDWISRWIANTPGFDRLGEELIRTPSTWMLEHHPKLSIVPFVRATDELSAYQLHPRLVTCHGWCANKYAARKHLDLSRSKSVIFHHTHRAQADVTRDPHSGSIVEAVSAGCLCKRQPIWMHGVPTDWVHGFWIAYIGRHSYTLFTVRIEMGRAVLPDGREVRA